MWNKLLICLSMADIFNGALLSRDDTEINHPNIILMLVNNLVSRALKSAYHLI